jgi:hypothetical protein
MNLEDYALSWMSALSGLPNGKTYQAQQILLDLKRYPKISMLYDNEINVEGIEDSEDDFFQINLGATSEGLLALINSFPKHYTHRLLKLYQEAKDSYERTYFENFSFETPRQVAERKSRLENVSDDEQLTRLKASRAIEKIYDDVDKITKPIISYKLFISLQTDIKNKDEYTINNLKKTSITYPSGCYELLTNLPSNEKGYLQYYKDHPNKALVGFFNRSLNIKISAKSREKHTYILAKSGSGKSELIKALIYGDILARKSAVILLDPHGDLADQVASFNPSIFKNGFDDVVYIDPTLKNDLSPSINPFDIPFANENELSRNTQEILKILEVLLKGADTTTQMSAILEPCITVLLRLKGASFTDLQRFMDDEENADLIALGRRSPNQQHAKIFNSKFQSKHYESTKNGIYTRMQLLLNDPIFQNLISNKTTINLNQLIEEKKVIIFKLSLGEGGSRSMEAFGRFIVGMIRIIALQRSSTPENQRTHTHLYIDEVQNFITDDLKNVLTQLRKYKVFLTSANQYAGQGYSSELQKALFSSEVLIMGKNEAKTAREVGMQINVPPQEIQNLSVGNFYLRIGNSSAVKMLVGTQLMNPSNQATYSHIEALKENSVKKYYSPINSSNSDIKEEIKQSQNTTTKKAFTPKYKL